LIHTHINKNKIQLTLYLNIDSTSVYVIVEEGIVLTNSVMCTNNELGILQ